MVELLRRPTARRSRRGLPWPAVVGVGVGTFLVGGFVVVSNAAESLSETIGLSGDRGEAVQEVEEPTVELDEAIAACDIGAAGDSLGKEGWTGEPDDSVRSIPCGPAFVEQLLDAGASSDSYDEGIERWALHRAVTRGDDATVALLLDRGADPSAVTDDGSTGLHLLTGTVTSEISLFGWHDEDVERIDENVRVAIAGRLLAAGADPNAEDRNDSTALAGTASSSDGPLVDLLLAAGAAAGDTTLLAASFVGNLPVVERLLAAGADPDLPSDRGHTPLVRAVARGHVDVVARLLANGASPEARAQVRTEELLLFALGIVGGPEQTSPTQRIDVLGPALGLDPDWSSSLRGEVGVFSPLYMAVAAGNDDIIRLLLDAGADPAVATEPAGHLPADAALLLKSARPRRRAPSRRRLTPCTNERRSTPRAEQRAPQERSRAQQVRTAQVSLRLPRIFSRSERSSRENVRTRPITTSARITNPVIWPAAKAVEASTAPILSDQPDPAVHSALSGTEAAPQVTGSGGRWRRSTTGRARRAHVRAAR